MRVVTSREFQSHKGQLTKYLEGEGDAVFVINGKWLERSFVAANPRYYASLVEEAGKEEVAEEVRGVLDAAEEEISERYRRMIKQRKDR